MIRIPRLCRCLAWSSRASARLRNALSPPQPKCRILPHMLPPTRQMPSPRAPISRSGSLGRASRPVILGPGIKRPG